MPNRYAKESKSIRKIRQKVKEKLKLEAKAMGKRTLKQVQKIIHLQAEAQINEAKATKTKKRGRPRKHTQEEIINTLRSKVLRQVSQVTEQVEKVTVISKRIPTSNNPIPE